MANQLICLELDRDFNKIISYYLYQTNCNKVICYIR